MKQRFVSVRLQTFHLYRDLNFWQLSYFAEDSLENEFVYSSRKCHWSTNLNLFDYHFLPRVQLDQGAQSLQCLTTFGRRCAWLCHWWAGLTSIKQSIHVTWIISTQSFTRIRTMMERLLFKRHKRDNLVIIGMNAVSIRLLFEENCIQEGFVFGDFWVKYERYFNVLRPCVL